MEQQKVASGHVWSKTLTFLMPPVYLAADPLLVDAIALKPLIKRLCGQHRQVWWPSIPVEFDSTLALFDDIPNLHVVKWENVDWENHWLRATGLVKMDLRSIPEYSQHQLNSIDTPITVCVNKHRQIYEYFDVCFGLRYQTLTNPRNFNQEQQVLLAQNPNQEPFLLCDRNLKQAQGFDLQQWRHRQGFQQLKEITYDPSENLLDWRTVIEQAHEIHVSYSSLWAMVDSLTSTRGRLFFHSRDTAHWIQVNCGRNSHKWTVIY